MITILTKIPHPYLHNDELDEKRYEWQMGIRANYLLLGDKAVSIPVDIINLPGQALLTTIQWINRGELIAGSFMSSAVQGTKALQFSDIDIYFKSKDDAIDFLRLNSIIHAAHQNDVLICGYDSQHSFNLIFGVHYDDPSDLITHFDIRAASIALDPSQNIVYAVAGSQVDCRMLRLVYNPVPHNTTIARLVKYIDKGFTIDPYQRLFLAELIKSDQYNSDLELSTGYGGVTK